MASTASQTSDSSAGGRVWQFGECEFDEVSYQLTVRNQVVDIETKPLEVLRQLLLRAGEMVRKEELLEAVWPGVLVVDASLATAVSKLRKALDDDTAIKTIPKLGYRFCGPVRCQVSGEVTVPSEIPVVPPVDGVPKRRSSDRGVSGSGASLTRRAFVGVVAALVLIGMFLGLTSFRSFNRTVPLARAVAILPFQNVGQNTNFEYLRSALPDQIANSLSMANSLTIRPVAATGRYADPSLDLHQAGRDLDVDRIVTGHYTIAGDQIQITVETVDTGENRVLWHETVNVPAGDLLQMQAQVAAISTGDLARSLGITQFVSDTTTPPSNEEAYELYLRSLALDWDPAPTRQAIELLRKSALLDGTYAPVWGQLSLRYYHASRFGGGGPAMLQLSDAAAQRQMELEPDAPGPVAELTIHRTERGDLVQAHQQALELVRRRLAILTIITS